MTVATKCKTLRNKTSLHLRSEFSGTGSLMLHGSNGNEFVVLTDSVVDKKGLFSGTVVHTTNAWNVGHYFKTWDASQFVPFVGKLRICSVGDAQ